MSQSSTHMLCSTFVSAKIRHGNLKTSVFNFCGSMLPGFADFNAKSNKKNLHGCNEYMNNDELRNSHNYLGMQISKPQLNCHVTPNQLHGCTQYTYFAPDNRSMVQTVTTILTNKTA